MQICAAERLVSKGDESRGISVQRGETRALAHTHTHTHSHTHTHTHTHGTLSG